jgi:hypothetical protein
LVLEALEPSNGSSADDAPISNQVPFLNGFKEGEVSSVLGPYGHGCEVRIGISTF